MLGEALHQRDVGTVRKVATCKHPPFHLAACHSLRFAPLNISCESIFGRQDLDKVPTKGALALVFARCKKLHLDLLKLFSAKLDRAMPPAADAGETL